jgi:hypothetical protein
MTAAFCWLFFRPKMMAFLGRLGLALRVATLVYIVLLVARLIHSGIDEEQLRTAAISLVFFGGLWAAAWLVTRSIARRPR